MTAVSIVRGGAERLDELQPLYRALHLHHAEAAPELGGLPAADREEAWRRRRRRYSSWLAQPDSFVLVAERGSRPIGFALVTVEEGYDGWGRGERLGEVRDLAMLPEERGAGVGELLLGQVAAALAAANIERYRLTVLGANTDAIRFYERQGMRPITQQMLGRTH
jgi:ribosomal protein S18 acetylase RimI-like enzyme